MSDEERLSEIHSDLREVETKRREKAVRWQKITIEQFGSSLNFFITLAVAALGYSFQLFRDPNFRPGCYGEILFLASLLLLSGSIVLGGWCTLNRLADFRGTTDRARKKVGAPSKETLTARGEHSWQLLRWMVWTLGIGVLALGLCLLFTYGRKL